MVAATAEHSVHSMHPAKKFSEYSEREGAHSGQLFWKIGGSAVTSLGVMSGLTVDAYVKGCACHHTTIVDGNPRKYNVDGNPRN
jgi:hypothetical protein